jgi:hypothetical protein
MTQKKNGAKKKVSACTDWDKSREPPDQIPIQYVQKIVHACFRLGHKIKVARTTIANADANASFSRFCSAKPKLEQNG